MRTTRSSITASSIPGSRTSKSRSRRSRSRAARGTCWTPSPAVARILVIDDDALLRGAIRVVLESAGYEVIEAGDGDAGLRLHREPGADLVVVDLFMPERDGLEVIRAVRAEAPQAKIIAMSGGSSLQLDLLDAATAFGASRALWKPFAPAMLLATVRELLGERGL